MVDKLERQIRKHKTKINRKSREKGQAYSTLTDTIAVAIEEEETSKIVRTKEFELEPMTPEEAVLQMNLLGHDFYLFFDGDTGKTCAVYRRNQDSYGLIETIR